MHREQQVLIMIMVFSSTQPEKKELYNLLYNEERQLRRTEQTAYGQMWEELERELVFVCKVEGPHKQPA